MYVCLQVMMCWFHVKPSHIGLKKSLHVLASREAFTHWTHVKPPMLALKLFSRDHFQGFDQELSLGVHITCWP